MMNMIAGFSGRHVVVAVMAVAGWVLAGCGGTTPEHPAGEPTEARSEPPQIAGSELGLPDQLAQPLGGSVQAMAVGDACNCCAGWNPACVIATGSNQNPNSGYRGSIQKVNGGYYCVCNTAPWNWLCTTSCF